MRERDWLDLTAGPETLSLEEGVTLRLLTAREVLAACREGAELAGEGHDPALCSNACLLARAMVQEGKGAFPTGRAVLEALEPREIEALARQWADFDRRVNPGLTAPARRVEELKDQLAARPQERLKWRVLRAFRALPTEERARAMTGRDYLWCALHLLLDQEEEMDRLCPACRDRAEVPRCPACGKETGEVVREVNPAFDMARFEELRKGGRP